MKNDCIKTMKSNYAKILYTKDLKKEIDGLKMDYPGGEKEINQLIQCIVSFSVLNMSQWHKIMLFDEDKSIFRALGIEKV